MTAQGEDILAFLDSAITSREYKATAVAGERGADWYYEDGFVRARREDDMVATGSQDFLERKQGEHIALNDPASVLRRCAADRQLIALHAVVPDHGKFTEGECPPDCDGEHTTPPVCFSCRTYTGDPVQAPCATLLALAEGYGWTEGQR